MPPQIENQNIPTNIEPQKGPSKWMKFASIIILIIIAVLIATYFIVKYQNTFQARMDAEESKAQLGLLTSTTDEFANWQTYWNEEYGFEFMYPENWVVKHWEGDKIFFICSPDLTSPCGPYPEMISADLTITIIDGKVLFSNLAKNINEKISNQISSTFKFIATSTQIINNSDTGRSNHIPGKILVNLYVGADRAAFNKFINEKGLKIIAEVKSINLFGIEVPIGKEEFYIDLFKKIESVQYATSDYYASVD